MMLGNNDGRRGHRGSQDVVHWPAPSCTEIEQINKCGQSCGCNDGCQGYIAEGKHHSHKDPHRDERRLWGQSGERPDTSCHPFSATKLQPDGEYMAQHGKQRRQRWKCITPAAISEGCETSDQESNAHCGVALGSIKN